MIHVDRRALLGGAVGGLLGFAGLKAAERRGHAGALFVACRANGEGRHFVTGFAQAGDQRFDLPLPARGHSMAFHPKRPEFVVFARRPGQFAVVIDDEEGVALHRIDAAPGRHFYGHGAFSTDGYTLFVTENDYASGEGVVGVYDASDRYRRIGEYASHGVGPHELVLMPDGKTLAIANGGIRTDPDQGRAKLNLDEMAPSLVFADLDDGRLLDQAVLPKDLHQLSIRHLSLLADGGIAIAMQYEGGRQDRAPLVGVHRRGGIAPLWAPDDIQRRMRHYGGSVAVDKAGRLIAVSAPRGNLVTFWDGLDLRYLTSVEIEDGCGVAPTEQAGQFLLTGGAGVMKVVEPMAESSEPVAIAGLDDAVWDNHLRLAGASIG